MIDGMDRDGRGLETALKALEQAKARVANERKKQNEKRRKMENRHKYMIGGIVVKYFPKCFRFDEEELNRILRVALATEECRRVMESIEKFDGNAGIADAGAEAADAGHGEG